MRWPAALPSSAFGRWGAALLALWLFALVLGPALADALGLALHAHGHPFADTRSWLGVPHAMDVFSNAPFLAAGVWGLLAMRLRRLARATREAARVFCAGLLLTGLGSACYHWAPDAAGLVWDRLGMAVAFAGVLALAVAERVGQVPARQALRGVLPLALLSALLPAVSGNVLPWAVVQFGGMALLVWLALRQPVAGAVGIRLGALVGLYALAKVLELGDGAVFLVTAGTVSGHSLKHIAAAGAALVVLACLGRQPTANDRPTPWTP